MEARLSYLKVTIVNTLRQRPLVPLKKCEIPGPRLAPALPTRVVQGVTHVIGQCWNAYHYKARQDHSRRPSTAERATRSRATEQEDGAGRPFLRRHLVGCLRDGP